MRSTISIVNAHTFDYEDQEKISCAVKEAISLLPSVHEIIKPGMTVLIKPNFVMDFNHNTSGGTNCLYTQASVIRPVLEFVISELKNSGTIIIGDAPMQECVFSNIKGIHELVDEYTQTGVDIKLVDFRELTSSYKHGVHFATINPDSEGTIVNLGMNSEFANISLRQSKKLRITNYDPRILPKHHVRDTQEYYISNWVLKSDVIINMPKPKTHRKAGVTISLKNLVGINVRKEFLPHHTIGSKTTKGDEYFKPNLIHAIQSRLFDLKNKAEANRVFFAAHLIHFFTFGLGLLLRIMREQYSEGSWYGNDTISKTIVDLNRILKYADKNGVIQEKQQRSMIIIGDMIVSGEKEGPVCPTPKNIGLIVAGLNPVCFDEMISTIMGFDHSKIPSIVRARNDETNLPLVDKDEYPLSCSTEKKWDCLTTDAVKWDDSLKFEPTTGWKGHIEKI